MKKTVTAILAAAAVTSTVMLPLTSASAAESVFLEAYGVEATVAEEQTAVIDKDYILDYYFREDYYTKTVREAKFAVYDTSYVVYRLYSPKVIMNGFKFEGSARDVESYFNLTRMPITLKDTDGDAWYDEMYIDVPETFAVGYTYEKNSVPMIFLKGYGKLRLDKPYTMTLDGSNITPSELKENDILSIKYDASDDFENSESYDITVSRNKVFESQFTYVDRANNIIKTENDDVFVLANGCECNFWTDYIVHLDYSGSAAWLEVKEKEKRYGIVSSVFRKAGDTNNTIRIIQSSGEVNDYELDRDSEGKIKELTGVSNLYDISIGGMFNDSGNIDAGLIEKRVIDYNVSDGVLKVNNGLKAISSGNLKFTEKTSKLGKTTVSDDATHMINIRNYINGSDMEAEKLHTCDFDDGVYYSGLTFDRNSDGTARFAVVYDGIGAVSSSASMALVTSNGRTSTINNERVYTYDVICGGVAETIDIPESVYDGYYASVQKGCVIVYNKKNGTVRNYSVLMPSISNYYQMYRKVSGSGDLASKFEINDAVYKDRLKFGIIAKTSGNTFRLIRDIYEGEERNSAYADLDKSDVIAVDNNTKITYLDFNFPETHKKHFGTLDKLPNVSAARWGYYGNGLTPIDGTVSSGAVFALVKEFDGIAKEIIIFMK